MKKFPQQIYVVRKKFGFDETLVVVKSLEQCGEIGEKKIVGVYQLDCTTLVWGKVMIEPTGKRKK